MFPQTPPPLCTDAQGHKACPHQQAWRKERIYRGRPQLSASTSGVIFCPLEMALAFVFTSDTGPWSIWQCKWVDLGHYPCAGICWTKGVVSDRPLSWAIAFFLLLALTWGSEAQKGKVCSRWCEKCPKHMKGTLCVLLTSYLYAPWLLAPS